MADAAGVVNPAGSGADAEFRSTLSDASDEVRQLALAVRELIYDVYPETVEVVWPRQRSTGWGIGPRKFTEQFAYFSPHKGHVTLGFYHGGELSDPDGLLPDSGGRQVSGTLSMRSLRITRKEDVARAGLRSLVEAAVRHQLALTP
jgi:Domain of unknown function (DU1801)